VVTNVSEEVSLKMEEEASSKNFYKTTGRINVDN
jgi:hypothetical protein